MKLFTVGPVEMFERTLKLKSEQLPYFRTDEFSKMMLKADGQLKYIVDASENSKTIYLTASGTGAMEATVMNCFNQQDKLLVINGGGFGERFEKICKIHRIEYTAIEVPLEKDLTEEMLLPYENCGYTGLLVNVHETSIGKLYDIAMLGKFCKRNNIFLVVDAISSLFIDAISMKEHCIDALIFSSQKALSLSPGMAGVVLSEQIIVERVLTNEVRSMYFDFKDYIVNFERGQTPFTPCVGTFIEYSDMIQVICDAGIAKIVEDKKRLANQFREELKKQGFGVPQYTMSNGLTPVYLDNAYEFYLKLKENYNLVVTPNGGALRDKVIRIGHMGNLDSCDYCYLLECMLKIRQE